ncbi:tetratricopeptide repeat protein [Spartinivicinus poritis]|uniref:Tetratricopeptide repeat protein n=1 Tax=Spartinivicinus poritis TaxID=2994640 RepID=A0ABT5UHY1_9GAMM|nr:hypothetical protein [Spartinivicinus sp. A2-2]MDE1466008.1 hypothetical protein [Spartinivicinus sp. A2-2]
MHSLSRKLLLVASCITLLFNANTYSAELLQCQCKGIEGANYCLKGGKQVRSGVKEFASSELANKLFGSTDADKIQNGWQCSKLKPSKPNLSVKSYDPTISTKETQLEKLVKDTPAELREEKAEEYYQQAARFNLNMKAIPIYEKAIALNPKHIKALLGKAAVYRSFFHYKELLQTSMKILALDNDNIKAWDYQVDALAGLDRCNEALRLIEKNREKYAGYPESNMSKAECQTKLGHYQKALENFDKVTDSHPGANSAWAAKYLIYQKLGKLQEAEYAKKQAIKHNFYEYWFDGYKRELKL